MKEFLEKIKKEYLGFIHFKQEQDEEIEKLNEKKKKLEQDIAIKSIEENRYLQSNYEDEEFIILKCKIKYYQKELESIEERIDTINEQIDKRRKPLEDTIDEEVQIKRDMIQQAKKTIKEKKSEIEQDKLQTQRKITDVRKLEIREELLIDSKKERINMLINEFNQRKNTLDKECDEFKELCEECQNDLEELEKLKSGLYKIIKRQVKEEVDKSNNEQEIEVNVNNKENEKETKKRNFILNLIKNKRKLKGKDEELSWKKTKTGDYVPNNKNERKKNTISDEAFYNSVKKSQTREGRENFSKELKENVEQIPTVTKIKAKEKEGKAKVEIDNREEL